MELVEIEGMPVDYAVDIHDRQTFMLAGGQKKAVSLMVWGARSPTMLTI